MGAAAIFGESIRRFQDGRAPSDTYEKLGVNRHQRMLAKGPPATAHNRS